MNQSIATGEAPQAILNQIECSAVTLDLHTRGRPPDVCNSTLTTSGLYTVRQLPVSSVVSSLKTAADDSYRLSCGSRAVSSRLRRALDGPVCSAQSVEDVRSSSFSKHGYPIMRSCNSAFGYWNSPSKAYL